MYKSSNQQYEIDLRSAKEFAGIRGGFPFAMLISSLILIVASAVVCGDFDCQGEGVLLALIGSIVLFVLTILYMCLQRSSSCGENLDLVSIVLFFIAWGILAGFLTFESPFFLPSNGYFAAWFGFFASTGLLVFNVRQAKTAKDRFLNQGLPLGFIFIGSIIVLIAGIAVVDKDNQGGILAIVAGTASLFAWVLRILLSDKFDPTLFAVFLLGWWLILGLILTFGVFKQVGNGFFGSWVCIFASMYLCFPH